MSHICYLFLHKPYGRGSGRYQRYILDYFKPKNKISLVAGMPVKPGLLPGIKIYNPAFDVTPASLITAIITEHGVFKNPNKRSLETLKKYAEEKA